MRDGPSESGEAERGDPRLRLLETLSSGEEKTVRPRPELGSSYGHGYPSAREIFGTDVGAELEPLEWLAERGYLERSFYDKIHLCPYCSHYALNFHEVCPRCGSADIGIVEMLHHYRCGHVGPETDFRQGVRFVCPKCERPLRHVGVDYERPTASYLCGACRHVFADPPVECRCLRCGENFEVARAVLKSIYSYSITEKGSLAATEKQLEEFDTVHSFIDDELVVYNYRFFEEQLSQQVRESRRYERPMAIMLVGPDTLESYRVEHGEAAAARLWKRIVQIVKEELRDCDLPSHTGDGVLAVLLPGTSLVGARVAAERILRRVASIENARVTVSIGLAGLFVDGEDEVVLLRAARERMEKVQTSGGNGVEPVHDDRAELTT